MYQQTWLLFHRLRYIVVSILILAFLVLASTLITHIGVSSISESKTASTANAVNSSVSDTSDAVTADIGSFLADTKQDMLSADVALYKTSRSITKLSAQSGTAVVHNSAVTLDSASNATIFVNNVLNDVLLFPVHLAGSGIMFTLSLPGKVMGSVTHTLAVSAILRPAANQSVPLISNKETSAAVLAGLNINQQQEIAKLQAAQVVANQSLDGVVVAGDPSHGGYPAQWDNPVPQDSLLDSWGMYNRECVSYTAWKVYQTYGSMPYWGGEGNANQWVGDAKAAGIPTGSTPQVHSVAISMRGYYGHAMWVEAVSGNMIYVSQYNYLLNGQYSEMWVNGSSFTYIYFH